MAVRACRPTDQERTRKLIAGEVICTKCEYPVGHPHCYHLSGQYIWDQLTAPVDNPTLLPVLNEVWGIAYPIEPPKGSHFHGRWVKPKGEDENYHYTSDTGLELHIRKNDYSGYHYTIHYENSPGHSYLGHLGDIVSRHTKRTREVNRQIRGRSTYTRPMDLPI
jgi:hypothetical protein